MVSLAYDKRQTLEQIPALEMLRFGYDLLPGLPASWASII